MTATWAEYHAEGYRIHVHCDPCDRHVILDLAKMPPNGNVIGAKLRCSQCGGRGQMIVQPAQSIGRRPT
jgi:hypothetical protein